MSFGALPSNVYVPLKGVPKSTGSGNGEAGSNALTPAIVPEYVNVTGPAHTFAAVRLKARPSPAPSLPGARQTLRGLIIAIAVHRILVWDAVARPQCKMRARRDPFVAPTIYRCIDAEIGESAAVIGSGDIRSLASL
jgi:hypothetical protein